ncbi:MAG TPA: BamA/TamA family outer membrane protein [Gemmatimonadales bacterium]|nr:BamA/TamA family outer membrane protein [Gemmatimonadales bacterium]
MKNRFLDCASLRAAPLGMTAFSLFCSPLAAQAPVIDHIELRRSSVFEVDEATIWPFRLVNSLHITTRPWVVRRELLFGAGDPWDSALVAESERNLRSLGVFRGVRIDSLRTDSGLVARVATHDGWSTRPDFRFKSTGGELDYTLAMIEDNLLGTASQASLLYRHTPDRNTTTLSFRQRRLIGGRIGLAARYDNRSDGERGMVSLGLPFHSMSARNSWTLTAERRDERVLIYRDGSATPVDSTFRDYALARLDVAHALRASTNGYLRIGAAALVRRDEYTDASGNGTPYGTNAALGGWIELRRARYLRVAGYNSLSIEEDLDLSNVARLGTWIAPAGPFGNHSTGVGPEVWLQTGARLPDGFLHVSGSANGLVGRGQLLDSGAARIGATAAWLPSPRHLAVAHFTAGALKRPVPGTEFDLGLGAGPRGFKQHAFTGDRMWFLSTEYRYGLAPDFLRLVDVGIAAFADAGGAWFSGATPRSGWDAGIGLRLGASRATDAEANRIDLVYRSRIDDQPAGWVLVVAKGFAFGGDLRGDR